MLITLKIDNSTSTFQGLSVAEAKQLKSLMSYYVSAMSPIKASLFDVRKHAFPTGLLYIVAEWARGKKLKVQDLRVRPKPSLSLSWQTSLPPPYPEQTLGAEAAYKRGQGVIVAPTGFGKSRLILEILHRLQVPTLIVVPKVGLREQLSATIEEAFGKNHKIQVKNIDALDPKTHVANYDCVIVDEYHHEAAKTYRALNKKCWNKVFYRFGLTATNFRADPQERLLLESMLSDIIFQVSDADAVKKGYICPIEAYYIDLPPVPCDPNTYAQGYSELVLHREDRNHHIAELCVNFLMAQRSALFLVKQVDHGERLQQLILEKHGIHVPFAHGKNEETPALIEAFSKGEIPVLIATSVVGEGTDTRAAEWVVLAGGIGTSPGQLMQWWGRTRRKYPGKDSGKVLAFRDPSHKWFRKQFNIFKKTLKEQHGVLPVKID